MIESNGQSPNPEICIQVRPDKRRRASIMVARLLPALLLLFSLTGPWPSAPENIALFGVSFIAGLMLIYTSVKSFLIPVKGSKSGEMLIVFTGLILIAQGSNIFSPVTGYQPAYLLLVPGALYVFFGVMFPAKRYRQGFHITDKEIVYKRSVLFKSGPVPRDGIISVAVNGLELNLSYSKGETRQIILSGAEDPVEANNSLRQFLEI